MELVHTLLFFLRKESFAADILLAAHCLSSLEKSAHKTVLVYNQGFLSNEQLAGFLSYFNLAVTIIGEGVNVGIAVGRQACFEHAWTHMPDAAFISELHLDMMFTHQWEVPLTDYLNAHDEPVISCGIVDKDGVINPLGETTEPPSLNPDLMDEYLSLLKRDVIMYGFTHPCIHRMDILKRIGGIDTRFLRAFQGFEDDSLLLGYYYYYGTKSGWRPKVNYQSVVYHETLAQRITVPGVMDNYEKLLLQYGAMGFKHLSGFCDSAISDNFFLERFNEIVSDNAAYAL